MFRTNWFLFNKKSLIFNMISCIIVKQVFCPSGEIGRRSGLKIHRPQKSCRFESGLGHHLVIKKVLKERTFFSFNKIYSVNNYNDKHTKTRFRAVMIYMNFWKYC